MKKTHLISVTGMTPSVVTETLYGIAKNNMDWPEKITIITTKKGKEKLIERLSSFNAIEKVCLEMNRPVIAFSDSDIKVVPDANNNEVDDARSLEDNEALANFIMTEIRNACTDEDIKIHASIAGGRKSMTFYLGYAMSIFGRKQDVLSHVLVSPDFENIPTFFYPTNESQKVTTRDGKEIDFKNAEVVLADIPFIRLNHLFDLKLFHKDRGKIDFRHLVDLVNFSYEPSSILLKVYQKGRKVEIYNENNQEPLETVHFNKNDFYWAMYLVFLSLPNDAHYTSANMIQILKPTFDKIAELYGISDKFSSISDQRKTLLEQVEEIGDEEVKHQVNIENLLKGLEGIEKEVEILNKQDKSEEEYKNFNTFLNTIKNIYLEYLPLSLVKYVIPQQYKQEGSKQKPYRINPKTKIVFSD